MRREWEERRGGGVREGERRAERRRGKERVEEGSGAREERSRGERRRRR